MAPMASFTSTARTLLRWCVRSEVVQVKKRFLIGVAQTPTGLAYDAKTNRLFIGCRNEPKMVVMDAATGKVIASFPIGVGVDFAVFDPGARLIFFSCAGPKAVMGLPLSSMTTSTRTPILCL